MTFSSCGGQDLVILWHMDGTCLTVGRSAGALGALAGGSTAAAIDVQAPILAGVPLLVAALIAGVPVHVVAACLGHADPLITLRVYAHVINERLVEAADIFARWVAAA